MTAVWRCRVCEGVNQGGRVCTTCGAVAAYGEPIRAAVRTRLPSARSTTSPTPPAVPPTPRPREVRDLPPLEELLMIEPFDLFSSEGRVEVHPIGGGCLFPGSGCLIPISPRPRRGGWL